MSADKEKRYLTPNEVAELLMVAPVTVRSWAQKGLLHAHTTPGGHRRFLRTEVERFAQSTGAMESVGSSPERRLLIVEDDAQLAAMLTELIAHHFPACVLDTASEGFAAGSKLHSFKPDTVLLDLMMPGLNGFEVCRQIRADAAFKHVKVVAMTGFHTPDNVAAILAAGAETCLPKPLDHTALFAALELSQAADSVPHLA